MQRSIALYLFVFITISQATFRVAKVRNNYVLNTNGDSTLYLPDGGCIHQDDKKLCPSLENKDDILGYSDVDRIRHIQLKDLNGVWPPSEPALAASEGHQSAAKLDIYGVHLTQTWGDPSAEGGPCDPEIFYWPNDSNYYMQYTGGIDDYHSVEYIARAKSLSGVPFAKYEGNKIWKVGSNRSVPIILPARKGNAEAYNQKATVRGVVNGYGAGQVTTVVKDGQIYTWVSGDRSTNKRYNFTLHGTAGGIQKYLIRTGSPTSWSKGNGVSYYYDPSGIDSAMYHYTSLENAYFYGGGTSNGIVRWDPISKVFRYFYIAGGYYEDTVVTEHPILKMMSSTDGLDWKNDNALFQLPMRSYELGVGADSVGWLPAGNWEFVWSAPQHLRPLPDTIKDYVNQPPQQHTGLYHYSLKPSDSATSMDAATRGTLVQSFNEYNIASRDFFNDKTNQDREYYNYYRYGYAPAVVKSGGYWHIFYCTEAVNDPSRRTFFPYILGGGF